MESLQPACLKYCRTKPSWRLHAQAISSGLVTTTLSTQFMSQTALNGSGNSSNYGLVKGLAATSCRGATNGRPADASNQNTFVQVSNITGACGQPLTAGTVAQYSHSCGLQIFISGYGSPGTVKVVEDECPRCGSGPPHFDNWLPGGGGSCGLGITDLQPTGYFVTEQRQQ